MELSVLGLGTVKFGRNTEVKYPSAFSIPDDNEVINILNCAGDCGINLIDTAPAYGNSEERLGKLLKKTHHSWIISTKVGEIFDPLTGQSSYNFTSEFIQQSIENSLRQLQLEQLDIVLIHSNGEDETIIKHEGALETLNHLKNKGLIRATGMSTKTIKGGFLAIDQSDIAMVTHNLEYQGEQDVIEYADKKNKNIFIKKGFASGHSAKNNVADSFRCIFKNDGVNSVILGSINTDHIKENCLEADHVLRELENV